MSVVKEEAIKLRNQSSFGSHEQRHNDQTQDQGSFCGKKIRRWHQEGRAVCRNARASSVTVLCLQTCYS